MIIKREIVGAFILIFVLLISSTVSAQVEDFTSSIEYDVNINPGSIGVSDSATLTVAASYPDGSPASGISLSLSSSLGRFSSSTITTQDDGSAQATYYPLANSNEQITSTVTVTILISNEDGDIVSSLAVTILGEELEQEEAPTITRRVPREGEPVLTRDESSEIENPNPANVCPTTSYVELMPAEIYSDSLVSAQAYGFNDNDGDAAAFNFEWFLNGQFVHSQEVNAPLSQLPNSVDFVKGDLIRVEVSPNDGTCMGGLVNAESVVLDKLPEITITHDSDETNPKESEEPVNFQVTIVDIDGDEIPPLMVDFGDGEMGTFTQTPTLQTLSTSTATSPAGDCSDGIDNDQDGLTDYPYDPGCDTTSDSDETNPSPLPECSDRQDNDGDFIADFPYEPGCISASDNDESNLVPAGECYDFNDNDQDGKFDYPEDPGCVSAADGSEIDPGALPECGDGVDNDQDGNIDFGQDVECFSASDSSESFSLSECHNFADDDQDGQIDFPNDLDCVNVFDPTEASSLPPGTVIECSDGVDNDGNGLTDYPDDPGCLSLQDSVEGPTGVMYECSDGLDNDGDGTYDYSSVSPNFDSDCVAASDDTESGSGTTTPTTVTITFSHTYMSPFNLSTYLVTTSSGGATITTSVTIVNPSTTPVYCPEVVGLKATLSSDLSSVDLTWNSPLSGNIDALKVCYIDGIDSSTDLGPYSPEFDAACNSNGVILSPGTTSFTDFTANQGSERYYKVQSLCDGTVVPPTTACTPNTLLGDLDGDGQITVIDVLYGSQISAGTLVFQGNNCCLDVNQDGTYMDIVDVLYMSQISTGMISNLGTCDNPLPPPGTCFDDGDCGSNEVCAISPGSSSGTCVPVPRECSATDILGDANGDGNVGILDALLIAQYSVGQFTLNNACCYNADAVGVEGGVLDALAVAQIDAGLARARGTCDNPLPPIRLCNSDDQCLQGQYCNAQGECEAGTPSPQSCEVLGDVNGDGSITVIDSLQLSQMAVGLIPVPGCCADANNDGRRGDVLDSLYASQVSVGIAPPLGTCNNPVVPGTCSLDSDCAMGEECLNGVCEVLNPSLPSCSGNSLLGDVNGDGRVDIIDSLHLSRIDVGLESIIGNECCADADNDGNAGTILDSLYVSQVATGQKPQLGTCDNPISPPGQPPSGVSCAQGQAVGDTDGDGDIDMEDARMAAEAAVRLFTPDEICCYDMNVNGAVDIIDGLAMAAVHEGLIGSPGVCGGTISPAFTCSDSNPCMLGTCVYSGGSLSPTQPGETGFCRSDLDIVQCSSGQLKGDADGNGIINLMDALVVSDVVTGSAQVSGDFCCLDPNGDGLISALDTLQISQHDASIITLTETCPASMPGTGLSILDATGAFTLGTLATPVASAGVSGGTSIPSLVSSSSTTTTANPLDKRMTTNTVGKFEIPIYETTEVYNEFSLPLRPDLSIEPFPKSIGLGRGTGNDPQLVGAGFVYCGQSDFSGSYDEIRHLSAKEYLSWQGSGAAVAISEASFAYDPTVDCRVYSYDDLMTLTATEPTFTYHLKGTQDDVLINVGEVIPLVAISTYDIGLNNWIGYTLTYDEVIEDALATPMRAVSFFTGFDRIQSFDVETYLSSRSQGKSVTQSYADANKDFVQGIPPSANTALTHFSPGEGYRFMITRDDSFEFEHGKKG